MTLIARSRQTIYIRPGEARNDIHAEWAAHDLATKQGIGLPHVMTVGVRLAQYRGGYYVTIEHDTFTADGTSTGVAITRHIIRHERMNKPAEDRFLWSMALRKGSAMRRQEAFIATTEER